MTEIRKLIPLRYLRCLRLSLWTAVALTGAMLVPPLYGRELRKPKVRAITAFVRIDRENYVEQLDRAVRLLRQAKAAFEKSGYEVETLRVTTQPFPDYVRGLTRQQALDFFASLNALSEKQSFSVSIGRANPGGAHGEIATDLLAEILATTNLNASVSVAGEDGIYWHAVGAAAKIMKYLETSSQNGVRNFDFAAAAMVPPYSPFFPTSYHNGDGHQFSVGLEAGNFVADVFQQAGGDFRRAEELLSQVLSTQARDLEVVGEQIQKDSGWTYMGLDATPAPNLDSSIAAGIESLIGGKFGSNGTLSAVRIITEAVQSIPVKRAGYSGLMLPVLEDPLLAQRWSEGTYNLDSLLAYSAVCGTGLDAVPLPGDVPEKQLERIIGDVASLALKWHKPLTARLILAPGKKPGERTEFDSPHLTNTALRALP